MTDERTIAQWMELFNDIYRKPNGQRTPNEIWLGVMLHCSAIGEGIRKADYGTVMKEAAHAFEWMCAFVKAVNRVPKEDTFALRQSLSEIVALKYPNKCGHCREAHCMCKSYLMEQRNDKSVRYDLLLDDWRAMKTVDFTVSRWQRVFDEIYRHNIHLLPPESIAFHLLEEVGEAASAVRRLTELRGVVEKKLVEPGFVKDLSSIEKMVLLSCENGYREVIYEEASIDCASQDEADLRKRLLDSKIHLVSEFADTFAWLCSTLNKLAHIAKLNGMSLDTLDSAIKTEYYNGEPNPTCPTCREESCSCFFCE